MWNVVLGVALPLISSAYVGLAEEAAEIARRAATPRGADPVVQGLVGEMENALTTARLALDDMIERADDHRFEPTLELANAMLVRKTLATRAAAETTRKAIEAVGGAGYFRSLGLERRLRDALAGDFHPLPERRQQRFTGRVALGRDPVAD